MKAFQGSALLHPAPCTSHTGSESGAPHTHTTPLYKERGVCVRVSGALYASVKGLCVSAYVCVRRLRTVQIAVLVWAPVSNLKGLP